MVRVEKTLVFELCVMNFQLDVLSAMIDGTSAVVVVVVKATQTKTRSLLLGQV